MIQTCGYSQEDVGYMSETNEELQAEIIELRSEYFALGIELGEIINEQQDSILALKAENKRLKRENWNLKKTKGRMK